MMHPQRNSKVCWIYFYMLFCWDGTRQETPQSHWILSRQTLFSIQWWLELRLPQCEMCSASCKERYFISVYACRLMYFLFCYFPRGVRKLIMRGLVISLHTEYRVNWQTGCVIKEANEKEERVPWCWTIAMEEKNFGKNQTMSLLCIFNNRECHIYISYYSVRKFWSLHMTMETKSSIAFCTNTVGENISVRRK